VWLHRIFKLRAIPFRDESGDESGNESVSGINPGLKPGLKPLSTKRKPPSRLDPSPSGRTFGRGPAIHGFYIRGTAGPRDTDFTSVVVHIRGTESPRDTDFTSMVWVSRMARHTCNEASAHARAEAPISDSSYLLMSTPLDGRFTCSCQSTVFMASSVSSVSAETGLPSAAASEGV
jgi:hypothetical protein